MVKTRQQLEEELKSLRKQINNKSVQLRKLKIKASEPTYAGAPTFRNATLVRLEQLKNRNKDLFKENLKLKEKVKELRKKK